VLWGVTCHWKFMYLVKGPFRTFPKWKRGRVGMKVKYVLLIAAGVLWERHTLANTRGKRRRSEFLRTDVFVVRIPHTDTLFIIWQVYIAITNQYSTFYYKHSFFLIWSFLLSIGGWQGNLVAIFGFSNIKTYVRLTLNLTGSDFFAD